MSSDATTLTRRMRKRILVSALSFVAAMALALTMIAFHEDAPMQPRTRPDWLSRSLYPFEDHWIDIDGNTIHYVDEGKGPTLLMLHGNPTWSFEHRNLIKALSGSYRCISLDYPGFGLSTARPGYSFLPREHSAVVEKFVFALQLKDLTVIMEDWGGPIALGFAGRHPELIRSLVIGNTWAWPVNGDPQFENFSNFMGGPLGKFLNCNFDFMVNVGIPTATAKSLSNQEMTAYRGPFPTHASRAPASIFAREIINSHDYLAEVESNLNKLADRPVLILWPLQDRAFKAKEREHFEAIFKNHRTVLLPNAKHFIHEDEPARISTEIKAFVSAPSMASTNAINTSDDEQLTVPMRAKHVGDPDFHCSQ